MEIVHSRCISFFGIRINPPFLPFTLEYLSALIICLASLLSIPAHQHAHLPSFSPLLLSHVHFPNQLSLVPPTPPLLPKRIPLVSLKCLRRLLSPLHLVTSLPANIVILYPFPPSVTIFIYHHTLSILSKSCDGYENHERAYIPTTKYYGRTCTHHNVSFTFFLSLSIWGEYTRQHPPTITSFH